MTSLRVLFAGFATAAAALAAVPSVLGLAGNPSFSHDVPVRVPSQARPADLEEGTEDPSAPPRSWLPSKTPALPTWARETTADGPGGGDDSAQPGRSDDSASASPHASTAGSEADTQSATTPRRSGDGSSSEPPARPSGQPEPSGS